jgi:hypothetical protein
MSALLLIERGYSVWKGDGKLMTKDEKAGPKRCPSCKSWDVYPRQLEDGSLRDWCPHCLEFLQKKKLKGDDSKNSEPFLFVKWYQNAESFGEKVGITIVIILILLFLILYGYIKNLQ